jgi:hypothetical protein
MSAQVPWRRVLVEAALIVVSILFAFGIQAGWEERQERQEERALLLNLQEEFDEARDTLVSAIERHRQWGALTVTLAEVGTSDGSPLPQDLAPEMGHISSVITGVITTHLNTGVLDGALESGSLDLISNPEIRSLLAAWPRTAGEFLEKQDYLWDLAVETRPLIFASVPFADRLLAAQGMVELLGLPARGSTSEPISSEFVALLESEVGRNYVAQRATWESFAVRDGEKLHEAMNELLALIQAELQ